MPEAARPAGQPAAGAVDRVGKYRIVAKIGQGAMGEVYRATDPILNRDLAIKVMVPSVSADPELSKRFLREAQSAARLNHPNVVTLHEFGEDQGRVFMAMELLDGRDLSHVIKQGALAGLEDKLSVMEQICDGLAYAHAMQIVHRDLKPANIHVSTAGRVKIMDFGLARLGASEMTRAGTVMGSPNYMSPEQVRGERADARSDIFALGSVFYELLSGRRAFDAETIVGILYKVTDSEPTPLESLSPDVPPVLVALVSKAMAKTPADRFQDARELREALDVCRRVLEGTLDETAALASLREARTLLSAPAAPEATDPEKTLGPATLPAHSTTLPRRPTTTRLPVVRPASGTQAPTRVPQSAPAAGTTSAPPAAPSHAPLYAAVAVAAVALLVGAATLVTLVNGNRAQPAQTGADSQARALVAVAVESALDAARKSLQYKDLRGASDAAERALRLDPQNAEALQIQGQAKTALLRVEAAVGEARAAVDAGDLDRATQALQRVLAEMPDHPVAAELSSQLNSRFKAQADEASKQVKRAAEEARKANAGALREYAQATALVREADQLYGQGRFTSAAQKFMEARRTFDAARRAAADISARAPTTLATQPAQPPLPTTPVTVPQTAATSLPAPPDTRAAITPVTTLPNPAASLATEDAAVRRVVGDLARAIETKDVVLYKTLRPSLSGDDERKLRAAFENVRTQEVQFTIESVAIAERQATVRVTRSGKVNGQAVPSLRQVMTLVKGPAGWTIRDIGQ
jgi:serine/threonine-protein kinase